VIEFLYKLSARQEYNQSSLCYDYLSENRNVEQNDVERNSLSQKTN